MRNGTKILLKINTIDDEIIIHHYKECGISLDGINLTKYALKLRKYANTFELWHENVLIGCCICYMNDFETNVAYISHIAVLPSKTRKGYGRRLISETEAYAKDLGFLCLELEVSKDNTNAYVFYTKLGFYIKEDRGKKWLLSKQI